MEYIKTYNDLITEKLIYKDGEKVPFNKKQSKNDLTRIGYLEIVNIPEIGDFVAKFDTGNGSTSSIMCDELTETDGWVDWTINGIHMHSKKSGISKVYNRDNERRVCVSLTIVFNGHTYKDVPFALIDRSKSYAKMLVNRTFINTCHSMIDTSKTFIVTERPKDFSVNKKSKYSGIRFNTTTGEDDERKPKIK